MMKLGFTLIEFMIVMIVVGLIALIGIPQFISDCGNRDDMEYNVGEESMIRFGDTPCVIKSVDSRYYRVMYKDEMGVYHVKTFSPAELLTKDEIYQNGEDSWE